MNKTNTSIKIKNPAKTALIRWVAIDIFFIILGLYSFLTFDIKSMDGMFILISITVILTSLFFLRSTFKDMKALDNAINNKVMIAHWTYTKDEWLNYLNHEERYRKDTSKIIAIVLFIITSIVFIPFIIIIPDGKPFMFFVMLGLFLLYFFMGWILPTIVFYFKKKSIGEVILLEKGVLLSNRYYTWDFPLSKFNSAKLVKKPYEHLAISYDFIDRTGLRNYVVNVPIPKTHRESIHDILRKFKD